VVITHHGVHPDSVHPRFAGSSLNPAFISDLTPLVAKADLWIHGHVHDSFDYQSPARASSPIHAAIRSISAAPKRWPISRGKSGF